MKKYDKSYGQLNAYYIKDFYNILNEDEKEEVSFTLFYKIIITYFTIWVRDLYDRWTIPIYFPFSGALRLTRARYMKKIIIKWLWYNMPDESTLAYVLMLKQARGNCPVSNKEKKAKEKNDILALPLNDPEFKRKNKLKQIFIG